MGILHLQESFLVQWWSSWKTYHVKLTTLKNPKPTRSRKTKPTHSTYHVARDSLSEVQSSTTLKAWDPFLHEHKCMRLPLMKWQMHEIFIFAWMNHFTTKGYFFDIGPSFSHSTSFIPFLLLWSLFLFLTSHIFHPFCNLLCLICEAMTHAQPGPIDGSLLCLQHNHILNKVWEGKEKMIHPRCNFV